MSAAYGRDADGADRSKAARARRAGRPAASHGGSDAGEPGRREPVVRAVGLSKRFHEGAVAVDAVKEAELSLRAGQVLLVLGPSGSGKTTLLSMIGCMLPPSSGSLHIRGQDVMALDPRALPAFRLRHVGFVFQTFRLLHALSAAENVELPLNLAGVRRPESRERALALLDELGLADRADFAPDTLSAGEKQRVAVARALVNGPELLLADEPTGSLDSAAGTRVVAMLCRAARDRDAALLIVSHDERIREHADAVLRMEDGALRR